MESGSAVTLQARLVAVAWVIGLGLLAVACGDKPPVSPPEPAEEARWLDRDKELVVKVQQALRRRGAEYGALVGDLENLYKPFTLRDALRGRIQTVITSKVEVPGIYTRAAWKGHLRVRIATQPVADAWVLGEEESPTARAARLRKEYFDKYIAAWTTFLQGLEVEETATAEDSLRLLEQLTEAPSLYREVFGALSLNTQLPMLDEDDLNLVRPHSRVRPRRGGALGHALSKRAPRLPPDPVEQYFQPLRALVEPGGTEDGRPQISALSQYQARLVSVRDALAAELRGAPGAQTQGLDEALAEAERVTRGALDALPEELRRAVSELLRGPLQVTRRTGRGRRSTELDRVVKDEICPRFNRQMARRFPFGRGEEAHLQDVTQFFRPGGTVWTAYEQKLRVDVVRRGDRFEAAPGRAASRSTIAFLQQAWEITCALFPEGRGTPQIRFEVRPHPAVVDAAKNLQVGEVTLEVEGKSMTYRNGPPEQWSYVWTGQNARARLRIRGAAGLDEELSFQGEWSLLRLLALAHKRAQGSWYRVEWTLRSGIRVPMDFRPERTFNPLFATLRLDCPR